MTTPTWHGDVKWVPPGSLSNHQRWGELLGFEAPAEEEELIASVRANKVIEPLIVTGANCASGPGVILSGSRRCRAALDARLPLVPVIERTDLTAEAEAEVLLKAALASAHTRKLRPSKLAEIEHHLYELRSRGQGFRSDLTSVGSNGRGGQDDTLTSVARDAGQSRNSVSDRRKVFFSQLSPKVLRDAVDVGAMSLTAAAALVRETEGQDAVREALRLDAGDPDARTLRAVKVQIEEHVRQLLKRPKRTRPRATGGTKLAGNAIVQLRHDGMPANVKIAGKSFSMRLSQVAESFVTLEIVQIPDRKGRRSRRKGPATAVDGNTEGNGTPSVSLVQRDGNSRAHLTIADPYARTNQHRFIENEITMLISSDKW